MYPADPIKITRDTEVVQIPDGNKVRLAKGTGVRIVQSLGGFYTIMTDWGNMVRLADKDADAIGKTPSTQSDMLDGPIPETEDEMKDLIYDQLRTVYDPEIPVNVVELGLVYKCDVSRAADKGYMVNVDMTLTAPGCGMGDVLRDDADRKIRSVPGVRDAKVSMVLEPPWNQGMMSEAAKLELGLA